MTRNLPGIANVARRSLGEGKLLVPTFSCVTTINVSATFSLFPKLIFFLNSHLVFLWNYSLVLSNCYCFPCLLLFRVELDKNFVAFHTWGPEGSTTLLRAWRQTEKKRNTRKGAGTIAGRNNHSNDNSYTRSQIHSHNHWFQWIMVHHAVTSCDV